MYLFGDLIQTSGKQYMRISRLEGVSIENAGVLDFNHFNGACGNMDDQFIFLCFDMNERPSKCRRATDPLGPFTEVARPYMYHLDTRISPSRSKFIINNLTKTSLSLIITEFQRKFLPSVRFQLTQKLTQKLKYLTT